jgi:hypothetical protein
VKFPLQPNTSAAQRDGATKDPYSFSMYFQATTDATTRVTQSLEEAADAASVAARRTAAGASRVMTIGWGGYAGLDREPACSVRLAGAPGAASAWFGNSPSDCLGGVWADDAGAGSSWDGFVWR